MKYLLDTNVLIDALRGRETVVRKLASISPDDCCVSAVSLFELESGALKSQQPNRELRKVRYLSSVFGLSAWDTSAASEAAIIRAELEAVGMKIGAYDTLLAGHAKSLQLILVTNNISEFSRVSKLSVENWR